MPVSTKVSVQQTAQKGIRDAQQRAVQNRNIRVGTGVVAAATGLGGVAKAATHIFTPGAGIVPIP